MSAAKMNQPAGQIVEAIYHPQPLRFRAKKLLMQKSPFFSQSQFNNGNNKGEMKPARIVKSIDSEIAKNLNVK